jgi:periplasmic divalent cation tolerance protein
MQRPVLLLTNAPDRETAVTIARLLVEKRLAACVNMLAGSHSVYRWNGRVEEAEEIPLLIKTTAARYTEVEEAIRTMHPYDLPELIVLSISDGLPSYLDWIIQETNKDVDV